MAKKTSVSIEFTDLNPSDLAKVTDLIDTLGYAVVGYSITAGDVKPKPSPVYRRKVSEVDTPYAPVWEDLPPNTADELKSDIEGTEAVSLDIQANTKDVSLDKPKNKNRGKSEEMKSNIKKFL